MVDGAGRILLGGLLAFVEAILGVGLVLPGEVAVAGLASTFEKPERALLLLAVTLGATAGDHLNYWLGRRYGLRIQRSRLIQRIGTDHWDRSVILIRRHGTFAVVLCRVVPVVRTLVAAAAGAAHLPYARFTVASFIGCVIWAAAWVLAGNVVRGLLEDPILGLAALGLAVAWGTLRMVRSHRRRASTAARVPRASARAARPHGGLLGGRRRRPSEVAAQSEQEAGAGPRGEDRLGVMPGEGHFGFGEAGEFADQRGPRSRREPLPDLAPRGGKKPRG